MKVIVLGCGGSAGVPMIGGADGRGDWGACDPAERRNRRTRSSIVVQGNDKRRLLVDTSPDMRAQLIDHGVASIDGVLFTHSHADHILGLDDVRILNRIIDRPLPVWGDTHTLAELQRRFDYAFLPWRPPGFIRPVLEPAPIKSGDCLPLVGMEVTVFDQDHGFGTTLGFRLGRFAYCTDVVDLNDAAWEVLEGVETWMVDCFQRDPHRTHASVSVVREWAAKLGAKRTILTHMGNDMDWAWMMRNLPRGLEPAYDGMEITIPD
jgi:phosphoribosyl 1,2-cyclic phosphate phosphodiesterase